MKTIDLETLESIIWDAAGMARDVCHCTNNVSRIRLFGLDKKSNFVRIRCIMCESLRKTVFYNHLTREFGTDFDGSPRFQAGWIRMSYPSMSRILGGHHTTWVMLSQRARRDDSLARPIEKVVNYLAAKYGGVAEAEPVVLMCSEMAS